MSPRASEVKGDVDIESQVEAFMKKQAEQESGGECTSRGHCAASSYL